MSDIKLRIAAAASAVLLAVLGASAAMGADATGCSGSATSYAADGTKIQSVRAPGAGATEQDPFQVSFDGTVSWRGSTDGAIRNGTWTVSAQPFSFAGAFANKSGKTSAAGTVSPSDYLPFAIPGLVHLTVDVTGQGGSCSVSGWIKFTGNPLTSPAGWVALAMTALGALGLLALARLIAHAPAGQPVRQLRFGRVVLGLLAGLVLGVGVAALLVMYGILALGTNWPIFVVLGSMLGCAIVGLIPRRVG